MAVCVRCAVAFTPEVYGSGFVAMNVGVRSTLRRPSAGGS